MAVLDRGNLAEHLIGMVCVSGVLEILYLVSGGGAIGGGDIKLMFACGLILGWKLILLAFVLGCIIGSVVHIIRMVRKKAGRMLAWVLICQPGFCWLLCGETGGSAGTCH